MGRRGVFFYVPVTGSRVAYIKLLMVMSTFMLGFHNMKST